MRSCKSDYSELLFAKCVSKTLNSFRNVGLARMLRKGYTIVGMVPTLAICQKENHESTRRR